MEEFISHGEVIGIKISTIKKGSIPITAPKHPVQLVTLKHPKGSYLKAHYHQAKKRTTTHLQECLFVKKGKIKIDLYNSQQEKFSEVILSAGEVFLLLNGGYGIHILKSAEMIEMKNGPFIEDKVIIGS